MPGPVGAGGGGRAERAAPDRRPRGPPDRLGPAGAGARWPGSRTCTARRRRQLSHEHPTGTIDTAALLPDLQRWSRTCTPTCSNGSREHPEIDARLRADAFAPVEKGGRTAQAYEVWRDDYLEQVAVAWVLACVFVRFLEDNDLIAGSYLAGRRRPAASGRGRARGVLPAPPARHRPRVPARRLPPRSARSRRRPTCSPRARRRSGPSAPRATAATRLLAFWQEIDPETGALVAVVHRPRGATPASWATCTRTSPRRPARSTRCCRRRSSSRSSSSTAR